MHASSKVYCQQTCAVLLKRTWLQEGMIKLNSSCRRPACAWVAAHHGPLLFPDTNVPRIAQSMAPMWQTVRLGHLVHQRALPWREAGREGNLQHISREECVCSMPSPGGTGWLVYSIESTPNSQSGVRTCTPSVSGFSRWIGWPLGGILELTFAGAFWNAEGTPRPHIG